MNKVLVETMSNIHGRLTAAINGQPTLEQTVEAYLKNPPKDLAEVHDPFKGRPVPTGTHQLLIEALGGRADVRTPAGIHGRLNTALGR